MEFSIGEFSKISGLSIKALRLYHEKEILIPGHVDPSSGYRYYDAPNMNKARIIVTLRDMDFTLGEIKKILEDYDDESELIPALEQQKNTISAKIRRYETILNILNEMIIREKEARTAFEQHHFDIEEKQLEPTLIAGIRYKGQYSEAGKHFGQIAKVMGRNICGVPIGLYYDGEYKEHDADCEACFPIKSPVESEGIVVRELTGGKCLSLVHRGPYDSIGRSYARILDHARSAGLKTQLPNTWRFPP